MVALTNVDKISLSVLVTTEYSLSGIVTTLFALTVLTTTSIVHNCTNDDTEIASSGIVTTVKCYDLTSDDNLVSQGNCLFMSESNHQSDAFAFVSLLEYCQETLTEGKKLSEPTNYIITEGERRGSVIYIHENYHYRKDRDRNEIIYVKCVNSLPPRSCISRGKIQKFSF